ncbi:hypothetical protein [Paenibacillus chitinolyticus]|uniref:hypothetical protein n=1 Tax=Paenibacillus chitinolyticus TaxID=79263 RepID=UPI00366319B9
MRLNKTAFIFVWLIGAAILFYGIMKLELYLDFNRANSVYSNTFVLDSFKILMYIVTGICSGTLFLTSQLTVHRPLFFAVFILSLILSYYPLLIFVVPMPMMDLLILHYQKFAFIAGLSLFMALYPFKSQTGVGSGKEEPSVTGAQVADTKSGI